MRERWRPTDPLGRFAWLMCHHFVTVEHGLAHGCRCGSCETFQLRWEDRHDRPRMIEGETLEPLVEQAWRELEG